ncbi:MAG: hypothetical protein ACYC2K_19060, partial [Gemmatimonadales bacterium]
MNAWRNGPTIRTVEGLAPRLASWDKHDHPSQVRLRAYLNEVTADAGDLPGGPLTLHLEVDVQKQAHLHHHHDLENYLTPLVKHLGARKFVHVTAVKFVGGGSRVTISRAIECEVPEPDLRYECDGSDWKASLRNTLIARPDQLLAPGSVEVR